MCVRVCVRMCVCVRARVCACVCVGEGVIFSNTKEGMGNCRRIQYILVIHWHNKKREAKYLKKKNHRHDGVGRVGWEGRVE